MSIWPTTIGILSTAAAFGSLTIPAVRRIGYGDVQFDWLGRELTFDEIEPDDMTVRMKTGSVMRCYRLGGLAYDTRPESEQVALHQGRTDFLHMVAGRDVSVRLFGVKRLREVSTPAVWPSPALAEIGDAETHLYRQSFEVRWYMTLTTSSLHQLEEADEKVHSVLSHYKPKHLLRPATKDGDCPLTGFLNFLVCGDLRDDLRAVSSNISANLPAADLLVDRTGEILSHVPTKTHQRVIAIRAWPDQTSGHLMHELLGLAGEIEVSQVCVPLKRDMDQLQLNRAAANPVASDQERAENLATVELLTEGKTSRFSTQFIIVLRAADGAALDHLTGQVARILGNRRVIYSVETKAAAVTWFNRLPDRNRLARPLKLLAENISALWPFESAPTGMAESQFGRGPVRFYRTGSGQSYAFQFQCSARPKSLGNFLVMAPSNSGKSTTILHLLGGLTKFHNVRSFIFDSKEGARYMVEVMGGLYQSFDRLQLNPLDTDDTPINRQRLALLIRSMLNEASQADDVDDVVSHVVETAFTLPVEARTFNKIFQLTFPPHSTMRKAFARWVTDDKGRSGLYSSVMNADRDSLGGLLSKSFMTAINMNEALDDPNLGPPVVAHIASAIERMARSGQVDGFIVFIDEAAKLLRNPAFRDLATEMYREYRKWGGSTGMAFQDPAALHKSGIAEAVIENTADFFFFPNPQGSRSSYDVFNLNDEQLGFIFGAPEGRKVLLVKRDAATGFEESVILDIDLTPLGRSLRFYKSGPDAVRHLHKIQQEHGEAWLENL